MTGGAFERVRAPMKAILVSAVLISAAMLLPVRAAAAEVQTTADPQADLSRYGTFVFLEADPGAPGAITDKLARDRLRHMIGIRLGTKGYAPAKKGETAELGVHYSGQVVPKQRALMVGRPGPYDYSWGRADIGGYDTTAYREGTLFVDLVDLGKSHLLWRARISDVFSAGYSEENWKKVDRALVEAFKSVPQRR